MAKQRANSVVFNTGIIVTRIIIRLAIGLFTTRLVLNALGETDYGIYTLVGGLIAMLEVLNVSMSIASMRFIANSLGTGNEDIIKTTFNSALIIHFILGFIVVIIMEVLGLLLFEYLLNIPIDRLYDAKIVYQFMVASTFLAIITVPFGALLNAHENFLTISIVDIIAAILNLSIAFFITYISSNQLIVYGGLIVLAQLVRRLFMQWYIRHKYKESKISIKKYVNKKVITNMLSFAGWSMLGALSYTFTVQLRNVLINMFFGVRLNAASGITGTLTGQLGTVSESLTQAVQPQIMKSEGGGDRKTMLYLTETTAKFSFFLLAIVAIPVFIETPYLLKLWLKNVPDYTIIFTRLLIVTMLLEKFTFPITTALQSVGKIKEITFITFILTFLGVPLIYFLFKLGMPPPTIYIVSIVITLLKSIARLMIGKKIADLSIKGYIAKVFIKGSVPLILSGILIPIPFLLLQQGIFRLIIVTLVYLVSSLIWIRYLGLTKDEFIRIRAIIIFVLKKVSLIP